MRTDLASVEQKTACAIRRRLFSDLKRQALAAERIPDRNSSSQEVAGVELGIVYDVVVMHFGSYEEFLPEVVAQVSGGIHQEMRAVDVDNADSTAGSASVEVVVKNHGLTTQASHKVGSEFVTDLPLEHRIHVKAGRKF
jgi:hypothetical protein